MTSRIQSCRGPPSPRGTTAPGIQKHVPPTAPGHASSRDGTISDIVSCRVVVKSFTSLPRHTRAQLFFYSGRRLKPALHAGRWLNVPFEARNVWFDSAEGENSSVIRSRSGSNLALF
ncbi:hypothetical protein EVAR_22721_1 [Eumeta japonica]|uniref:Uncharacterized protein n=1 Tax=Eumeta variegata TaxID=151549 RepID=A0A4C1USR0_EUMVA|nr:hypothetical protein EVAR_22721_1 [Eumeta japonica]